VIGVRTESREHGVEEICWAHRLLDRFLAASIGLSDHSPFLDATAKE
jgi:Mn-dependent DtxR family transcriptional regulator